MNKYTRTFELLGNGGIDDWIFSIIQIDELPAELH